MIVKCLTTGASQVYIKSGCLVDISTMSVELVKWNHSNFYSEMELLMHTANRIIAMSIINNAWVDPHDNGMAAYKFNGFSVRWMRHCQRHKFNAIDVIIVSSQCSTRFNDAMPIKRRDVRHNKRLVQNCRFVYLSRFKNSFSSLNEPVPIRTIRN